MSSSDWYTRNSYGLTVAVLLVVASPAVYSTLLKTGYKEGYKDAKASGGGAEANYELYQRCFRLGVREEVLNCLKAEVEPERANERAEEDLQAQWNMVFWAAFAAIVALIVGALSVAVGFFGVIFVKRTLDATVGMLEESRKTTEIGQKQLIASERPWLEISLEVEGPFIYTKSQQEIGVIVTTKNVGKSPAHIRFQDVYFHLQESDPFDLSCINIEGFLDIPDERPESSIVLFPGKTRRSLSRSFKLPDQIASVDRLDDVETYIIARAIYVFGQSPKKHRSLIVRNLNWARGKGGIRTSLFQEEIRIEAEDLELYQNVKCADYAD